MSGSMLENGEDKVSTVDQSRQLALLLTALRSMIEGCKFVNADSVVT